MKVFFRIVLFLLILIIGAAGIAIYHTFYNQLPDPEANHNLPGLQSAVDIHWDPYGVPYIYSDNESDLYYTIGYIHARDRLWQLTLSQLMAEGRFAEFLGESFIEIDKHQRTLGIWETANKIHDDTSPEIMSFLEHYSDGINDFVEQNRQRLPVEMNLLEIDPIEWTPVHSIAVSRLMAWDQNIQWKSELALALLTAESGINKIDQLLPEEFLPELSARTVSPNAETAQSLAYSLLKNEQAIDSILQKRGTAVGSNAWALNSSQTNTGAPLLAGDPHMGLSIPGFWYELHATLPDQTITGATIPGAPFIILGQNSNLAWSVTNMMADDTDFYLIQTNPENPSQYVADSTNGEAVFENFEWRQEIIKVEGSDDELFRVQETQYGPVINSVHPDSSHLGIQPVSLRWGGHNVSHELQSFYELNRAETLQDFLSGLEHFGSPVMNFIYADNEDNIARIGAGRLPARTAPGLQFAEGWQSEDDWQDTIPFEEMPRSVNPASGYVINANNSVVSESYPWYIGQFWASDSRFTRIQNLIDDAERTDAEFMRQIQNDVYSIHAAELIEILLPLLRSAQQEDEFETVLTYLENWDYRYTVNSTAATIFDLFFINLSGELLQRDVPAHLLEGIFRLEYLPVRMVTSILTDGSSYFNIADEETERFRLNTIQTAMNKTIGQLTEQLGEEPFEWRWEALHTLTLKPPLLADIAAHSEAPGALRLIVENLLSEGPHPVPGHGMTINKGEYSWNKPFEMTLGPSIRRVVDFSNLSRSFSVLPTGQSGHPLSTNYADQTDLWLEGRYRYIYSDSTFFREVNAQTTKLEPLSIQ